MLLEEELRIGKAEAIDALLDIADREEIVLAHDEREDRLLHAVRILILVDHDFLVLFVQGESLCRGAQLPCRCSSIAQHSEREMLQVVEIHDAALLLRCLEGGGESLDEIDDDMRHARKSAQIVKDLCFRRMKILFLETFEILLHTVARQREEVLRRLLLVFVHAPGKTHSCMTIGGKRLTQFLPIAFRQGGEQVLEDLLVRFQSGVARFIAKRGRLFDETFEGGQTSLQNEGNLCKHRLRP